MRVSMSMHACLFVCARARGVCLCGWNGGGVLSFAPVDSEPSHPLPLRVSASVSAGVVHDSGNNIKVPVGMPFLFG